MNRTFSKELIIIGGGPAGLKAAEEAGRHKIDYIAFEKGNVGQAWREIRPEMYLLSPCHPQRDWTSFSSKFPIWKMGVQRPYCRASEFINYMDAYTDHFKLNIELNTSVTNINFNHDSLQYEVCVEDKTYTAPVITVATGIFGNPFIPEIPGVKNNPIVMHSHHYRSAEEFKNKRVLIVGTGNSAAEIAIDLCGHSLVYLISREDLKFFSDTKKLYHIRGISESYLKELISMEIIRYRAYQNIQRIEGNRVYFRDWELEVDKIIFATGYLPNIKVAKNFHLRFNRKNYPEVAYSGESIQQPNLFFAGPLAYQTSASIVVHGFVKLIPYTVDQIAERLKTIPTRR